VPDVDVFNALANPVRRRLLELLAEAPRNAGALAGEFDLSRPAISEHLQVLRRAALVHEEIRGRERRYELAAEPLVAVGEWLRPFERYWRDRLTALSDFLREEPEP
jgi:DNA-binding transcriptional ArsR family regulator